MIYVVDTYSIIFRMRSSITECFNREIALIENIVPMNSLTTLMLMYVVIFTNEIFFTASRVWSKIKFGICTVENIWNRFNKSWIKFVCMTVIRYVWIIDQWWWMCCVRWRIGWIIWWLSLLLWCIRIDGYTFWI